MDILWSSIKKLLKKIKECGSQWVSKMKKVLDGTWLNNLIDFERSL